MDNDRTPSPVAFDSRDAAATSPGFALPALTFTLDNGLAVVVHTDRTAPAVALSITYRVGSQHERPGASGRAHLIEHLMARSTRDLKPRAISDLVESNGGERNAYTTRGHTTYYSVVPRSALQILLWAEAERMGQLDSDERVLAIERQVVVEEMRLRYARAYAEAHEAGVAEAAFSRWENRHSTIGDPQDVRSVRLEDVVAFHQAHYAPNNAVLALAGDVDEADARALTERFFGRLRRRPIAPAPDLAEPPLAADARSVVAERFAKVPLVLCGWRAPERGTRDYWALTTLADIAGLGEGSPFHRALVRDAAVAFRVMARFPFWSDAFAPDRPDLFGLQIALNSGVSVDAALQVLDGVLVEVASGGLAPELLAAAKARIELSWMRQIEQLVDRAKILSAYAALVGHPAGLADDFTALMSVTATDVCRAVADWLMDGKRAVVEARPSPDAPVPAEKEFPPIPPASERRAGDPPPLFDPQPPMVVPQLERFTLANGLRVVVARDSRLPLVEARLLFPGGRLAERSGEEGLSSAAAELLMCSSGERNTDTLAADFGRMGWQVSSGGGVTNISVHAVGLSRSAPAFFRALAAILRDPAYPQEAVAFWREHKAAEIGVEWSSAQRLARERLRMELFRSHPYGRPPLANEEIAAVTRERIDRWRRRSILPGGAVLVLAGDADPTVMQRTLEQTLAGWTGDIPPLAVPPVTTPSEPQLVVVDRPAALRACLCVAQVLRLDPRDPDYLAALVAHQILGASATSRLFMNLRGEKGYTYAAFARPQQFPNALLWSASAYVRYEIVESARHEIHREIVQLRDREMPRETLEAVKRQLAGQFLLDNASIDRQAGTLATYERDGQSAEWELATFLDRLNALTAADVQHVASRYLDPDRLVTVLLGDERLLGAAGQR